MFLYRNQSRPITRLPLLILRDLVLCPAQHREEMWYRITPVTYTTAIYYFMYRFLSGLCRHHQGVHHTLDAQAHHSLAGLHRAGVGRGEECACPAVQRLINADEYLLSGTSQVAVSDQ